MDENPYRSPTEFKAPASVPDSPRWSPFTWAVVGFGIGTLAVSPLVLSVSRIDRAIGGAIFGGIPVAIYTFMSVVDKRRKKAEEAPRDRNVP